MKQRRIQLNASSVRGWRNVSLPPLASRISPPNQYGICVMYQPGSIGIVHVSRAGSLVLPDPASLQCPAADGSTTFETGLFEDLAARSVLGSSLSLKFDTPSDGNCQTLEGNRQDLGAVLSSVPDNTTAPICVAGVAGGQSFECCVSVKVLNKGNRR